MQTEIIIAGFAMGVGVFGMLFKINRCVGRQEGEIKGLTQLLMAHLNKKV